MVVVAAVVVVVIMAVVAHLRTPWLRIEQLGVVVGDVVG